MSTVESKGIAVKLNVSEDIIKENLSRIGIVNRNDKKLYPSCYLIKDDSGQYSICHFKELLKVVGVDESDKMRRDTITWLLDKWGLVTVPTDTEITISKKKLFILTKEQKETEAWTIIHKFHYDKKEKI